MKLLIAFVIALAVSFGLRNPIRKAPVVFYAIAVLADVVFLSQIMFDINSQVARAVHPYFSRCLLAYAFFAIVMFMGVFSPSSKIRQWLAPIRGELSIIAAILTFGHVANYTQSYLTQLLSGFVGAHAAFAMSFVVAAVLTVLLAVLTVTSFRAVRRAMNAKTWKRVQWFAYPFFVLIGVHVALVLGASASNFGQQAFMSVLAYSSITVVYVIARGARALLDKKAADEGIEVESMAVLEG